MQYNPAFGIKLNTKDVLEVTTLKILNNNGLNGVRDVILKLNPKSENRIGNKGFKGQAQIIGAKIMQKYPQIKLATEKINSHYTSDFKKSKHFQEMYKNILDTLGNEIDIVI